jgi:small-conductance mechanosensitive channel
LPGSYLAGGINIYLLFAFLAAGYLVAVFFIGFIPVSRSARSSLFGILHAVILIGLCEYLKRFIFPEFAKALKGLELMLAAWLCVHLIADLYIGRFLVQRQKFPVSRIVRDTIKLVIVALFVILFLRGVLDWNLAAILTPSAILTAIVGLAMQDTIGNFIAGLLIQVEKPFEINDWIEIEGQQGQVKELNWRYTKVETLDRYYMIIPNSKIATQKVVNYSKPTPTVNEHLTIGVSYDVPPLKVKRAIEAILHSNPNVVRDDEEGVCLHEYADSSIIYKIRYAIRDFSIHREVRDEIYSAIWYQFRKQAIEIPYPIRTVIMQSQPAPRDDSQFIGILSAIPFFSGASNDGLANLLRFGLMRDYEPAKVVVENDAEGDSMFFILAGEFNVVRDGQVVSVLGKGEFFGEMSLLTGEKRSARVEAKTRGTLLEIDRHAFKILLENEPAIMRQIENVFNQRASANREAMQDKAACEEIKRTLWSRFKRIFGLA